MVCGPGNNGGDGVASGRILHMQGYQVAIFLPFERERCSVQMKAQLEIAENLGMRIISSADINEYNIIIDAMFGIGLTKPIEGRLADIINDINKGSHRVFSVDIPSGISADTGRILNTAVRADYTITFGFMKQGLLVYPGADYAGEIYVADIGFPQEALQSVKPDTFYYTLEDQNLLPKRRNDGHKGTFAYWLLREAKDERAAYLSAKACLRAGAGMVKVLSASNNAILFRQLSRKRCLRPMIRMKTCHPH